jgi:hypothetical protein
VLQTGELRCKVPSTLLIRLQSSRVCDVLYIVIEWFILDIEADKYLKHFPENGGSKLLRYVVTLMSTSNHGIVFRKNM